MKKACALLIGTSLSLVGSAAMAQAQWQGSYSPTAPPVRSSGIDNLGEEMQFVFGVDRVMGISWDRLTLESDVGGTTVTQTTKTTNISLFGSGGGQTTNIPRLALDFFVTEGISIGGSLVYLHRSISQELDPDPGNASGDVGSGSLFAIHPRVGYAYPFDETFSIWPRLGITYFSYTEEVIDVSETTTSGFDLTGEVMLGISPMSNFAILIGPYLDLGLSGTQETTDLSPGGATTELDSTLTSFGLAVSIVGYY